MSRVGIGLPVRNGAEYLREALTALTNQTHNDLEIVVYDNASTDATRQIVEEFRADARVQLISHDENIGAVENFNRAFRESSTEYFMWAAHDDVFDIHYVEHCLAALSARSDAAGACSSVTFIDEASERVGEARLSSALGSPDLRERLRAYLREPGYFHVYGVMRREALTKTRLFQPSHGPDVLLVWELLLAHPLVVLADPLFRYRQLPDRRAEALTVPFGEKRPDPRFPAYSLRRQMFIAVAEAGLSPADVRSARRALRMGLAAWRGAWYSDFRKELERARVKRNLPAAAASAGAMAILQPARTARALQALLRRRHGGPE